MRKKINRHTLRIIVLSVLFFVVLTANIATSASRFRMLVSGDSSSNGAGWTFKVGDINAATTRTFSFNLADYAVSSGIVRAGHIAPSSHGTITLNLDCTACQVDVRWTALLSEFENSTYPDNIIFWTTSKASPLTLGTDVITGVIDFNIADQSTQTHQLVINWEWVVDTNADESEFAGKTFCYSLDIIAEQIQP